MQGLEPAQPVQRAGWLSKEGKRLKGRNRRYLVLEGTKLSHHVKENTPPTWEVDINEVRLSLGERPLEFIISAGGRSVAFFAESQEDLMGWVQALKSASSVLEDFYRLGKQLGKGSYGEVFLATDKLSGKKYAAKIITKNPNNRKQKKFIERERTIMTTVQHKNIVRTLDVFDGPNKLAIVSEYMEGGELFDLIIASQYFTEEVCDPVPVGRYKTDSVNDISCDLKVDLSPPKLTKLALQMTIPLSQLRRHCRKPGT